MINFKSKLPQTPTTIFTEMSHLATKLGAINLSQGFPNFDTSPILIGLVEKYMKMGFNQYAPMQGAPALRQVLSSSFEAIHNSFYDPETEITITSGATQAVFTAITTVVGKGDEVIVVEPAFDIYVPSIIMNGGVPRFIKLQTPDYKINWDEFAALINSKTRLIIINTPHNPTSSVLNEADMLELQKLTNGTDIAIVSDEVYEHMIFDGMQHQSVCRFEGLKQRSFLIGSFGKTFHVTGWKTGFCMAPKYLMSEFRKIHQNVVFAGNHPMQLAISEFMQDNTNYINNNQFYQEKRDYFEGLMKESRLKAIPSAGTYFQLYSFGEISDETDMEFVMRITREFGVATIPLSYFYSDKFDNKTIRVCFAKTNETLEKAAERLCKI